MFYRHRSKTANISMNKQNLSKNLCRVCPLWAPVTSYIPKFHIFFIPVFYMKNLFMFRCDSVIMQVNQMFQYFSTSQIPEFSTHLLYPLPEFPGDNVPDTCSRSHNSRPSLKQVPYLSFQVLENSSPVVDSYLHHVMNHQSLPIML